MKKAFTILLMLVTIACFSQDSWLPETNFPAGNRYGAFYFSLGLKIYVGTGTSGTEPYKSDFWEYEPVYNVWTQKADFGGGIRVLGVGFSIGNKGYAGTGLKGYYEWTKDMWEYDPVSNTWTQKADFSGGLRATSTSFSVGNKAYVGTGYYQLSSNVNSTFFNDIWEYDPTLDSWTKKTDMPGDGRAEAGSMCINNKGYIGFGHNNNILKNDFWEFDPSSDTWTSKADLPATERSGPAMFSIENKGYVVSGWAGYPLKDTWEFDPAANHWTRKTDFPAEGRSEGIGLTVGNKGYVGLGSGTQNYNDLFEYRTYPVSFACPHDTTVTASSGCIAVVNGLDPVFSPVGETPLMLYQIIYNGSVISSGFGSASGKTFGLGDSHVCYQLADWPGSCCFTVTVVDGPPTLTCPNDVSFYKNESNMYTVAELVASDYCGIDETNYEISGATTRSGTGLNASGIFNLGVSTITWTVKDIHNNTSTCSMTVTILIETMPTITICDQTWMQKNLNVTKYRNGDPIPQVSDPGVWNSLTTGAWCYYNNDPATEVTYGKLYNWFAVNDPRGLAPQGWHIPNNSEWIALENCAGGYFTGGGALKETGTVHWRSPNNGATNSTGFTALPGGMRSGGGNFTFLSIAGNWWSASAGSHTVPGGIVLQGGYFRSLFYGNALFYGNEFYYQYPEAPIADFLSGMSVRCVKDIAPSFTSCPSHQTVYSTQDSCNRTVAYNAVATGNPAPAISYSFTGATSGSGSGTGSGQIFNRGTTTVTVFASTATDTATCVFNVTVLDTVRPVIVCPAPVKFCYQEGGNYLISPITASDNCGIESIKYAINGSTVRNGVGPNASGTFNPGTSTVSWSIRDSSGNVSTCTTVVKVNNRLTVSIPDTYPLLLWGKANTLYIGFGPKCALLVAIPSGGTPFPGINRYRYAWSNGSTSIYSTACPPLIEGSYTYTVTVTDSSGCTATASKTIKVVDARCGPRGDGVVLCWYGHSQSCYPEWQAILALYFGGAKLGPCNQYNTTQIQEQGKSKEILTGPAIKINVFPNPSEGSFNLNIQSQKTEKVLITIFDGLGKKLEQMNGLAGKTYTFGQQYKAGIYFVEVRQGTEKYMLKVIKQ